MSFLQFRIHPSQHPEFVDEALMVAGALSVSFIDAADDPVLEPGPGETPLWAQTVVLGLFDPTVKVDESRRCCAPWSPTAPRCKLTPS